MECAYWGNHCRGEQVHVMCAMEELMPSIGTSVPSPSVLAVAICQSESTLQHVAKICSDAPDSPSAEVDFDNPFDFCDDSVHSTTHMISISDDGKVWNWLLTAEGTGDNLKDTVADSHEIPLIGDNANAVAVTDGLGKESGKQQEFGSGNKNRLPSTLSQDLSFRVSKLVCHLECYFMFSFMHPAWWLLAVDCKISC